MADFKISRIRFTWKGSWVTGTTYSKDDIVNYGGKSYVCLIANTASASFYTDLQASTPIWTLWFDGYHWAGVWAPNTLYNVGDYVSYGSLVYICSTSHTSAGTVTLGLEASQSAWNSYAVTDNWTSTWAVSVRYKQGDVVRYGGTVYRCLTGHTSAATLEVNQSYWQVIVYDPDWKRDWLPNIQYRVGDTVRYGGIVYNCNTGHLSASTTTIGLEANLGSWTIIHSGIDFKSNWSSATRYKANDIVKFGADLWICTIYHLSTSTFSTANFSIYVPGLEFTGTWSVATSYEQGDIVSYGGYQYTSNTTNNAGNIPSTDSTDWTLVTQSYKIQGDWSNNASYQVGNVVRQNGILYVAILDSSGIDPTDVAHWSVLIPGTQWKGYWTTSTSFVPGDIVLYYSSSYVCKQNHISQSTNTPKVDNTLTTIYVAGASGTGPLSVQTGNITATAAGTNVTVSSSSGLSIGEPFVVAGTGGGGLTAGTYYVGSIVDSTHVTLASSLSNIIANSYLTFTSASLSGTTFTATPSVPGQATLTFAAQANIPYPAGSSIVISGMVPSRYNGTYTVIYATTSSVVYANTTTGYTSSGSVTNSSSYWNLFVAGDRFDALLNYGDIPTYNLSMPAAVPVGVNGNLLKATTVSTNGINNLVPSWSNFGPINKVYYVATTGTDAPGYGTTISNPWASIRYACANVVGPATIFIKTGTYTEIIPISIPIGVAIIGDELRGTVVQPASGLANQNMFLVRNGTGIRNMTLQGLSGGLSLANQYGTYRPTGGSYVSLDPGNGPTDNSVWITTKSPYCQNVTMFGYGVTGVKIDGTLHNGGNRSIVANDFTTILSDGIGAWVTGPNALSELVSVFAYYGTCGYLAENGGRIRATNGNSSYGTYGVVAEGYDTTEVPLAGTINNRTQQATVVAAFAGQASNKILRLEFANAGQNYTSATYTFAGAGTGAQVIADEFRDGGIFETRITGPSDISAGGTGYLTAANQAQAGTAQTITIASNDANTVTNYAGMRLIITSGTGVGQYGYIQYYNTVNKVVTMGRESFTQVTATGTSSASNTITVTSSATFSLNQAIVINPSTEVTTATASTSVGNLLTLQSTAGMFVGQTLSFSGSFIFGGLLAGTAYYITSITGNQITLSLTSGGATIPLTIYPGIITPVQTMPAVATGVLGGLTWGTIYYVNSIPNSNQITVSTSPAFTFSGTTSSVTTPTVITGIASTSGFVVGGLITGPGIPSSTTVTIISLNSITISNAATASATVTLAYTGPTASLSTNNGLSYIGAVGWDSIIPGNPIVALLDSTSVYSIEARVTFANPGFNAQGQSLPISANWSAVAYGAGYFIAVDSSTNSAYSTNGTIWTSGLGLPNGTYTSMAYGNGLFVAVGTASGTVSTTSTGTGWNTAILPLSANWSSIAYGSGTFITIANGVSNTATSTNGTSWSNGGSLPNTNAWTSVAYGSIGTWVAVASGSNTAAYSTNNGSQWNSSTLPVSDSWVSVAWGNARYVAIASSTSAAYSFDGQTWISSTLPANLTWTQISYAQGLFVAVASGTAVCATSQDGLVWNLQTMSSSAAWSSIVFGNPTVGGTVTPVWVAVAGSSSSTVAKILAGAQAFGRAVVASGSVSQIKMYEPGSGYTGAPTCTITDPNNTLQVTTFCRVATGVLGNPTFLNRGNGYQTSTTTVTVQGNGFRDSYQPNQYLYISGLSSSPTPGAALTISGNANLYRIVTITPLGSGTYYFQISPNLTISTAPSHGTTISIRQKYSQVRLTGHDFLYIGTGNQATTNYPNVNIQTAAIYKQIAENNSGRVFQTSTDQDGNFKVGNLFGVQQASGIVTISANQFSLAGLTKLVIGGLSAGPNSVTITSFSTDSYFTSNSDQTVPTQKAIKAYIARNIAGGGSNAETGAVVAGTVGIGGPNKIYSSTGTQVFVRNVMNVHGGVTGGVNGRMLAMTFFANSWGSGNDGWESGPISNPQGM